MVAVRVGGVQTDSDTPVPQQDGGSQWLVVRYTVRIGDSYLGPYALHCL